MTGAHERYDDAALLRAHVDGDPDAFTEIVRRHRDRLWAVALRTLGDREEAADAVQDALVSAYRSADRFRGESAVTTWLHRIVVNACLDRARRRHARPSVPLPDHDSELGIRRTADSSDESGLDTALTVQAALARLPWEQRVPLVLLDMQGYSVAEIAAMLGIAEGTVKSRCARGRARLAVILGHLGPMTAGEAATNRRKRPSVPGNRPSPENVRSSGSKPSYTDRSGQGGVS